MRIIASIPSPSFNTIDIWPRPLTLYGLMIGLGIIAATMLSRPRLAKRSIHPDTAVEMLMWVVPAGVVGARLYHVITDAKPFNQWHEIWNGGLGIPGAIAGGAIGALFFIRNRGLPKSPLIDAVVPALPLAQAIGRWGNWWNQELYGGPTDLPWALEIDSAHRISGYGDVETFHPTFLYESIWNLALCGLLLWVDRKGLLKPGKLIWVYTGGYAIGRLWIEMLRIDPATEILGLRINLWIMGLILAVSVFLLRNARADESSTGSATATKTKATETGTNAKTAKAATTAGVAAAATAGAAAKKATSTATKKRSSTNASDDYDEDAATSSASDASEEE